MASTGSGAQVQSCPSCRKPVSTAGLEPFGKVDCPSCGQPSRVERVFDEKFVVVEPLGSGGMGSVFKARDTRLDRFVALKLLRREFADDASFTAKLQEEARITAAIKHLHVVEVYSVGEDHGQFYVVMELVGGGSLDDRMEDEKRLSERQTLEVGLQVAQGLRAALRAGLIHRDIKPGNILFADRNTAKIVDFGLAMLAAQHAETGGEIWGTPYYVAPERLTGAKEDFRSDLYSLGATLFHAAAGRPIFEAATHSAAKLKRLKSNPISLREVAPGLSLETTTVIDRMLRPDPADRQSSYAELLSELQAAHASVCGREGGGRGSGLRSSRLFASLGGFLLLLLVGFGAFFAWRQFATNKAVPAQAGEMAAPPAPVNDQLAMARRELEARHDAVAEALFREIAASRPEIRPAAHLCAGLRLWESGQFARAATLLRQFEQFPVPPSAAWLNDLKPLARDRLHDERLFRDWEQGRAAVSDPEQALRQIRVVQGQLKTKGALAFQLADEEAKLSAEVSERSKIHAEEAKKRASEEAPHWQSVLAAARKASASYQFDDARELLEGVELSAASLQAARDVELQRARCLADWKMRLIRDINETGFGGAITDIHGVHYDGPVRRATPEKFALRTRYGIVMTDWLNLPPTMLLRMSTAFIRPGASEISHRQWESAMFALQAGEREQASKLAHAAAEASSEFRNLLPRFSPPNSGRLAHQLLPFEGDMRALLLLLLTGMALSALAELPPLTMKDVGLMLRTGYSSDSVLQEVKRRRVRGVLDGPAKQSLTEFGGSPELISALASGAFSLSDSEAEEAHRDATSRAQHQAQEAQRIYRSATETLKTQQQAQVNAPGYPLANSLAGKLVAFRNGTFEGADDSQFEKKKLIAFYFSAHWCAPCRKFTPQLVDYYNRVAPEHPEFEIVFVSSDRSRFNWETYIRDTRMPWLALAYDQLDAVPGLKQVAGESIPSLILLDDTGHLLATSYEGESYAGPQKVVAELDKIFASAKPGGVASNR